MKRGAQPIPYSKARANRSCFLLPFFAFETARFEPFILQSEFLPPVDYDKTSAEERKTLRRISDLAAIRCILDNHRMTKRAELLLNVITDSRSGLLSLAQKADQISYEARLERILITDALCFSGTVPDVVIELPFQATSH